MRGDSADLVEALYTAADAIKNGRNNDSPVRLLSRGGVTYAEVDLSDARLAGGLDGKDFALLAGHGLRFMRHGSNPGARLELGFGGNLATKFWAPGQRISGGFDNLQLKRAPNSARVGKAVFAVLNKADTDLTEDLIISALGPIDLLGSMDAAGALTPVAVPEDTTPNAAYGTQVGAFDGSGWELLRVYMQGAAFESANVHFFHNPSWTGTTWYHASIDGVYEVPNNSPVAAHPTRVFMVPWGGRGVGCVAAYSVLPAGLTAVNFNIQGVR